jgi:hypothetical protein
VCGGGGHGHFLSDCLLSDLRTLFHVAVCDCLGERVFIDPHKKHGSGAG